MNILFIVPLAHAGLALATALSATLNAALLYWQLRKQGIYTPLVESHWRSFILKILFACLLMSLWLWWGTQDQQVWWDSSALKRSVLLLWWIGSAIAVYFASLLLMGLHIRRFLANHA